MKRFKLLWNGKPFNAEDVENDLRFSVIEAAIDHIQEVVEGFESELTECGGIVSLDINKEFNGLIMNFKDVPEGLQESIQEALAQDENDDS
ncbi:MAG: hypothetical protein JNL57_02110 [Bacteroidetes bacterium]|nr:hypothetical protein [Bacteroidota bacterium]